MKMPRVVAFLGQHQDSSDTIYKILQRLDQGQHVLNVLIELGFDEEFIRNDALNKLLTREYWPRAWIVQEIVLGRMTEGYNAAPIKSHFWP